MIEHELDLSGMRVLVIDDTGLMRSMHEKHLVALGFNKKNIFAAKDGEMGWKMLNDFVGSNNPPHLVISDWDMPKISGIQLLVKIKANPLLRGFGFIMVTGHNPEEYEQVEAMGMEGVIRKPFKEDTYAKKIIEVMTKVITGQL